MAQPRSAVRHPVEAIVNVHRLANGYFTRHPALGIALMVIVFGIAGAVAPAVELLLLGGL